MCRSTEVYIHRNRLQIRAFYLRFKISRSKPPFPETITLHYLPRISEAPLDINDSKIRSNSDAFLTLHRVRSAESPQQVAYAAKERVRVGEAVRFDVYVGEEKVLKGIFRKDDEEEWRIQCECLLQRDQNLIITSCCTQILEAEVSVLADGHAGRLLNQKVDMIRNRKKRCRTRGFKGLLLDEIPEEKETEAESDASFRSCASSNCDCCCCNSTSGSDDDHVQDDSSDLDISTMEMEMDGVRWAVDVGIWVVCFGVGYLVSKASSKRLIRSRLIL